MSQTLSKDDEPLYAGYGDTPINTNWYSVKGTAYGIPTVTKKGNAGDDSGDDNTTSYAFSISGITTPAEANGNYIEQSAGVYKHETNEYYVSRDNMMAYWCLSPTVKPNNPGNANFYGNGSHGIANPWEVTDWHHDSVSTQPGAGTLVITKGGSDSGNGGDDSETTNTYPSYRTTNNPGTASVSGTYVYSPELSTEGSNSVWVNENDIFAMKVVPAERPAEMGGGYTVNIYIGPKQSLASLSYSYCTYYGSGSANNVEDAFMAKCLPSAVFTSGNVLQGTSPYPVFEEIASDGGDSGNDDNVEDTLT
jgi:hypothetical protein